MTVTSVLLVSDDIAALASARAVMWDAGYAVSEALNGRRALQQVIANAPDVVITQILMPDGDGIELITAVKSQFPDIGVIAVSDRRFLGYLDLFKLAENLGAHVLMDNPLGAENLLGAVARLVAATADPS